MCVLLGFVSLRIPGSLYPTLDSFRAFTEQLLLTFSAFLSFPDVYLFSSFIIIFRCSGLLQAHLASLSIFVTLQEKGLHPCTMHFSEWQPAKEGCVRTPCASLGLDASSTATCFCHKAQFCLPPPLKEGC